MNKLFAQLLQQAASRSPQAVRAVRGFADDLAAPVVRSIGTVEDILVRPTKTFYGKLTSPATAYPPGTAALNLVKQNVGRFTPDVPLPPLRMPASPATAVGQVGGILQNLKQGAAPYFTPSSAFAKVPGPGWAKSLFAPTSVAGTILGLTQLEGSTPQDQPKSREWQTKVSEMTGQYGRYAPANYRYQYNLEGVAPPGSTPPAPDLNTGLFAGPQAGQLTPPPPRLPGTGVLSNGAGVPAQRQNVLNRSLSQEVLNAAQQYAAPTNVPLSAFYEGQQQLGRSMMQQGNLVSELQRLGAAPGMAPENLKAWAQANPDLAYREFLRLKQNQ